MNILIIGKVWPEPDSSAAGSRILQLIELFQQQNWELSFASAASESDYSTNLNSFGIKAVPILLNDSSFDHFIAELKPDLVLFDRFMTEEQFGWRVAEVCPEALRILDTEDLHGLRDARRIALKEKRESNKEDLHNETSLREMASIYRSDLSLIISEFEMELLHHSFNMDQSLIHYTPFMPDSVSGKESESWNTFEERKHFVWIGNFLHEPNWDTVQYLKKEIWPTIRKELPSVELHIYGAYPKDKVFQLHNEREGFLVKGRASSVAEVFSSARVLLAPIRFGAGLKGKFIEAMQHGLPSITTRIGAEGIPGVLGWPGSIANTTNEIVQMAIELYTSSAKWERAQLHGLKILNNRFNKESHSNTLVRRLQELRKVIKQHRANNFIGAMLQHHTMSSTKFMGKWIEEKNKGVS